MHKIACFLVALSISTSAWGGDTLETGSPPQWVEAFPAAKRGASLPEAPPEAPVALLRMSQQVRFGADADERYFESAVKILTPQGLATMGTISLPWQPEVATLIIHKLHIVRGDERMDVLANGQEFTILRREAQLESAILDGVLTATIQPEGLQVGDILELAFTVRYRDPVLARHSEYLAEIPPNLPGTRVYLAAHWPEDMTIRWRKGNSLPAPRQWKDKSGNHLALTIDPVPQLTAPKNAPARFHPALRLEFSDYADWGALSASLAPLYEKAAVIPAGSPLQAEVEKIRRASSDPKARAEAVLRLVQERVRYVYQGMNMGNLVPATAADTWARRFGDCKGKTALLVALLRALDIKAEPAAVTTLFGDGLDQRLPMAGLLNHILVRAEISGQTYWLDGTRMGDRALDKVAVPPFRWALPIRAEAASLVPLHQPPLAAPTTETEVWLDASQGIAMPATAEVTVIYRGDEALQIHQQLSAVSPVELDKILKSYWEKEYRFIKAETVGNRFDAQTGELRLTLEGKADLGWDGGYELDGAALGWEPDYTRDPGPDIDAPVTVAFPYYVKNRQTILLPKRGVGFTIDGEDVDKTLVGFAFLRRTRIEDGVLTMEASTRAVAPEIPYADALRQADDLRALDKVRVFVREPKGYARTAAEETALLSANPSDSDGYVTRGNAFLDRREFDQAIADFDKAVELDADNAWAWANRGVARAEKRENEKALDDLDKAAALDPRNFVIFHGRATVLKNQGDFGGAIAALTRAIDLKAENFWAYWQRADLHRWQGEYEKALQDTDAMLKIQPDSQFAIDLRKNILMLMGRYEDALASLDRIEDGKTVSMGKAQILAKMGKAAEARALFAELRKIAGKNSEIFNYLCWAQAETGFDLELALADCMTASKFKPNFAQYLDSQGLVLLRLDRFDEAIGRYDKALAQMPDLPHSLYGRGIAKIRQGAVEAGQADIKAAKDKMPWIAAYFAEIGVKP